mgnify:CR=1 FL=1
MTGVQTCALPISKPGWYCRINKETGEVIGSNTRAGDIVDNREFWKSVLSETDFPQWIQSKYKLSDVNIMEDEDA